MQFGQSLSASCLHYQIKPSHQTGRTVKNFLISCFSPTPTPVSSQLNALENTPGNIQILPDVQMLGDVEMRGNIRIANQFGSGGKNNGKRLRVSHPYTRSLLQPFSPRPNCRPKSWILLNNIAVLNQQLWRQIINKSQRLYYVKFHQDTQRVLADNLYAMAHGFGIEKRHWGKYQIVWAKSYQHKHYGLGETSKHKNWQIENDTGE